MPKRIYDAMREAGAEKIRRADEEASSRTTTRAKRHAQKVEVPDDANPVEMPKPDNMELIDDQPTELIGDDPIELDLPDTTNFYEDVNDDAANDSLDVDWDGEDLVDNSEDHVMSPLMDLLQCLGASASGSANYCAKVIKNSPKRITQFGNAYNPTFFEMYGQGNIVQASHGVRRNLNVNGLRAFDLRTCKPTGEAWDFNKASDRQEARKYVEEEKPTWVIGCPPCTFFSLWNQSMNHRKMPPEKI